MRNLVLCQSVWMGVAAATSLVAFDRPRAAPQMTALVVDHLRTEYKDNPLGLGTSRPRLSWRIHGEGRGIVQADYQLRVARSTADLASGRSLVWDSGRVKSNESIQQPYAGRALQSRQRYYWQVRIWDDKGGDSLWSEPAW